MGAIFCVTEKWGAKEEVMGIKLEKINFGKYWIPSKGIWVCSLFDGEPLENLNKGFTWSELNFNSTNLTTKSRVDWNGESPNETS